MPRGQRQFCIKNTTVEKAKLVLTEFENKYPNYKERWAFELAGQKDDTMIFQMVDHGFESPRGKGESSSPFFRLNFQQNGEDVLLQWSLAWKKSKLNLSWSLLWTLAVSILILILSLKGDLLVLSVGIWTFCAVLYSGWVHENCRHDRITQDLFVELLSRNFRSQEKADGTELLDQKE